MGALSSELILILTPSLPLGLALLTLAPFLRGTVFRLTPLAALPGLLVAGLPVGTDLSLSGVLLGTRFMVDEVSQVFAGFTGLIWLLGGLVMEATQAHDRMRNRFAVLFLLCMAGNLGMVVSQDWISFYLFYAVMGFSAYGLIVHNGTPGARRAGRVYMYLVIAAEIALFAAVVLIARHAVTIRFATALDMVPGTLAMACVAVAFAVKAGALPLHFSLPMIYRRAPPAAGLVLAGAMLNAGLLGWMRYYPIGDAALPGWGTLFIGMGLAAAFYGVGIGLFQRHPRALLGYSSISQMGLMTTCVGMGLLAPGMWPAALSAVLVYALHHALAKSALFLAIDTVPGLPKKTRLCGFVLVMLPALALAGLPLTSGAVAKTALGMAADQISEPWPALLHILLPAAAVGTTWLVLRFVVILWRQRSSERPAPLTAGSWLLLIVCVAAVVWRHPLAEQAAAASLSWDKTWAGLWPVFVGALAAWGWQKWEQRRGRMFSLPAGDIVYFGSILARKSRPLRQRLRVDMTPLFELPGRITQWAILTTRGPLLNWEWLAGRWSIASTAALLALLLLALALT